MNSEKTVTATVQKFSNNLRDGWGIYEVQSMGQNLLFKSGCELCSIFKATQ